jgi:CheY-like chemotaxis protein
MTISRDVLRNWDVLVIDDEPDSLDVARRILRFYGAEVTTASNGEEGWVAIKKKRPTLVISDISMPILDGWGVIERLKKDRATMDIPAIALTAHAMVGDRERALSAGFHNYLTKPLTPATFIKDLLNLLIDIPELAGMLKEFTNE